MSDDDNNISNNKTSKELKKKGKETRQSEKVLHVKTPLPLYTLSFPRLFLLEFTV